MTGAEFAAFAEKDLAELGKGQVGQSDSVFSADPRRSIVSQTIWSDVDLDLLANKEISKMIPCPQLRVSIAF